MMNFLVPTATLTFISWDIYFFVRNGIYFKINIRFHIFARFTFVWMIIEQYFTEYILSIKRAKELGLTVINFIKIDTLNFFLDDKNDKYEIVTVLDKP